MDTTRGTRSRRLWIEVGVVAVVCFGIGGLVTVASTRGIRVGRSTAGQTPIQGAMVSPDGRTLTLAFTGARPWLGPAAACGADHEARAEVDDTTVVVAIDRIEARWRLGGASDCPVDGFRRVASITLASPLGGRRLVAGDRGGEELVPFDGAKLLRLVDGPPGFDVSQQGGGVKDGREAWWRTFSAEPYDVPPVPGKPPAAWFQVEQFTPIGPLPVVPGPVHEATVTRDVAIARGTAVYTDGSSGPHLSWVAHGLTVRIYGRTRHTPDGELVPFDEAELIGIADALR